MIDPKHKKRFWGLVGILAIVLTAGLLMAANTNNQRGVANKAYMFLGNYPTSGNYYFVDNTSSYAQDSCIRNGGTWDQPFNTIDAVIGCTSANNGDIIFVAVKHKEDLSTASFIDLDVAGVRLIGMGKGRNRPTLTWVGTDNDITTGGTNVTIEVAASNTSIENFVLDMSGVSSPHTGVSVQTGVSSFFFLNNTVIVSDEDGGKVGQAIHMTGGTNSVISGNEFIGSGVSTSGVTQAIFFSVARIDNVEVSDNYFDFFVDNAMVYGNSAVSGFRMSDSTTILAYSASSPFYFSAANGLIEGMVNNVVSTGGVTGTTLIEVMTLDLFKNISN